LKWVGPVANHSVSPYQGYAGLREVRSDLPNGRIARVFFYVSGAEMILLHGFVKKTQKTPEKDLKLANKRKKEHERYETEKN
jgi:phage-related protein